MLIGSRVRLRALERSDLPTIVRWLNDPATRALLARNTPLSMAEEERFFEALQKSTTDVVFIIETRPRRAREGARVVGSCGIHRIDWKNRNAAVGMVIGDVADRGRGWGTDAMRALVRHCVMDLGLHRVELEVFTDNVPARKSYERVGFSVDGIRRQAMFKDGGFKDLVVMSILAPEVLAMQKEPR